MQLRVWSVCQTAVGGTHEVVREGDHHWYTHITGKVRVKEWERTRTLWCKGHGRVKPGSARPPDPGTLWCCSLQDVGPWGGSVWRGPGTGPLPQCQRDSGTLPLSPKKMYVALGGAGGKVTYKEPGERGLGSKQTDIRSLSQRLVAWCVNITLPKELASWSSNMPMWDSTGNSWNTEA